MMRHNYRTEPVPDWATVDQMWNAFAGNMSDQVSAATFNQCRDLFHIGALYTLYSVMTAFMQKDATPETIDRYVSSLEVDLRAWLYRFATQQKES